MSFSPEPFTVTGTTTKSIFARILKSCAPAAVASSMSATTMSLPTVETFRRIVTLPRSDGIARVSRDDFYLAEPSIPGCVGGVIPQAVLAAQFLRDLIKDFRKSVLIADDECLPASLCREL